MNIIERIITDILRTLSPDTCKRNKSRDLCNLLAPDTPLLYSHEGGCLHNLWDTYRQVCRYPPCRTLVYILHCAHTDLVDTSPLVKKKKLLI